MDQEVLIKHADSLESFLLGIIDGLLVVGVTTDEGAEPTTERWQDLGIGKGHPSKNRGVVLLSLTQKACLLILRGYYRL